MNPTEQAARVLADVRPHKEQLDVWADELIADLAMSCGFDAQDYETKIAALSAIREKLELSADHCGDNTLAAIARHLAPGDDMKLIADCELAAKVMADAGTFETGQSILREAAARISALTATVGEAREQRSDAEARMETAEAETATLRDRLARMEGNDEFQEQQRRDAFARRNLNAPEDPHVAVLCERYGYGAVMDAASRLWARKDSMGAFYIGGCIGIKPGDAKDGSRS